MVRDWPRSWFRGLFAPSWGGSAVETGWFRGVLHPEKEKKRDLDLAVQLGEGEHVAVKDDHVLTSLEKLSYDLVL